MRQLYLFRNSFKKLFRSQCTSMRIPKYSKCPKYIYFHKNIFNNAHVLLKSTQCRNERKIRACRSQLFRIPMLKWNAEMQKWRGNDARSGRQQRGLPTCSAAGSRKKTQKTVEYKTHWVAERNRIVRSG